jgi:hypothetical protein
VILHEYESIDDPRHHTATIEEGSTMKPLLICLVVFISIILSAAPCLAQDSVDVVQLKNGSIIRGEIIELVADSLVKIKTADGNLFVFKMSEVELITKEYRERPPQGVAAQDSIGGPLSTESHFSLFGGLSLPAGDFASTSGGAAKLGYTIGAEYELRFGKYVGWIIQFNYTRNAIDDDALRGQFGLGGFPFNLSSTPWITLAPVTGVKLTGPLSPDFSVFCTLGAGAAFGTSPELNITGQGFSVNQSAAKATAFTFSISGGFLVADIFRVDAKYMETTLKYDISVHATAPGLEISGTGQAEQKTSVILIEVGVEF